MKNSALVKTISRKDDIVLEGTFNEILDTLSQCLNQYPRRQPGRLLMNNRSLEYADLHSFYHQAVQIFKSELYGFTTHKSDPVIIDCGAHIGLASIYFAKKYPRSKIFAFEADPVIAKMLRHNMESLGYTHVNVHSKAVWVNEDGVNFNKTGDDSGCVSGAPAINDIQIPSIRLRSLLSEQHVDLLKMDIEGAEFDVIKDCRDILNNAKRVIVEIHRLDQDFGSLGDLIKVFERNNFQYTFGDLHAANWLKFFSDPPFTACNTNKYIMTLYAWLPDEPKVSMGERFPVATREGSIQKEKENELADIVRGDGPIPIRKSHAKTIKVVHLCSQDYGGAGKAAYRLHHGLQAKNVKSTMLVLNKTSADASVKVLPPNYFGTRVNCLDVSTYHSPLWNQQAVRWHHLLSGYPRRPSGLEMFTDAESVVRLDRVKEIQEADIVNLHWMAGVWDYANAVVAMKHKTIVWTLHDMNPFTGGCHYAGDCLKFKISCGACPQLGSSNEYDHSQEIWTQKFYTNQNLKINIVTPSRWLGGCAKESALFRNCSLDIIPNGFPMDVFRPYPKAPIRKTLNLPNDARVILFGADSVTNKRKGFAYLLEALNRFPPKGDDEYILLTFGGLPKGTKIPSRYQVINTGKIADETQLAKIYSAADLFVIPSLEDNLPNTVVEAMACGLPVVGFNIGGVPDMIEHQHTGYLAKPKHTADLIQGINWVVSSYEKGVNFSQICRKKVEKAFSLDAQATAYSNLYNRLLNTGKR